jgi:signal transduction histidine kinase
MPSLRSIEPDPSMRPLPVIAAERLRRGERHDTPDARRASAAEIERQAALVGASPIVAALLDAVDAVLLVLNDRRQVVAWNGPRRDAPALGLRPGELLGCANASGPGGCGTDPACASCGALGAILGCERTVRPLGADCLIPTAEGPSRELDVRATPVQLEGERFTVVTLRDVTAERRREALEQIFFHDILNTASAVRGWAWHVGRGGSDLNKAGERIDALSRQLEREIRDHQAFVLAEQGTLVACPETVRAQELLDEISAMFSQHVVTRARTLQTALGAPELTLETDRALLGRVLVNMVRNALEATAPGGSVLLRSDREPGDGASVRFSVHNAGAMPADVQSRVFQRSFSTKGPGRGLGTYGMKLLGERYLRGAVSFTSCPTAGTTFAIRLPARLSAPAAPSAGRAPRG